MKKGKLIVIDGSDGAGKKTQTDLLYDALLNLKHRVEKIDFPRYKNNFFGKLAGEFQTNDDVEFSKMHPMLASIVYAADRWESKDQIESWLNYGINVICDRYVSANQLHQGGKIKNEEERRKFLEDIDYMEHKVFCIPRPDLIIFLDVPQHISLELMKNKNAGDKKDYSRRKTDKVEQDPIYLLNALESGKKMLSNKSWIHIQCSEDGKSILPKEVIHQKVLKECLKII